MSLLEKLNEKQREAAATIEGPLLILAGAGSGKTRTITYRIAHMIEELGIPAYLILAMTFTNKAAKEMKERVISLIGEEAERATISTFHSFGVRLLRIYGSKLGYQANFTIYDVEDQKRIIKAIIRELNLQNTDLSEKKLASLISKLKEEGISADDYEKDNYEYEAKIIAEIYRRYDARLKNQNGIDFSDILLNTRKLLDIPEILEKIQNRYQYIMVDEYQDTNNIQYEIVNKIAQKHRNICVVGDENQSIYGFRGANIQNILNFEKDYQDAMVVKLEQNYRSTAMILEAANAVIRNNLSSKDKNLWTNKENGDKIKVLKALNQRDEVEKVISEIAKEKQKGRAYRDMTILYRTNAQSRVFEEAFLRYRIPYKIFGGMQFYQRAEIKDILAYLSLINNPLDETNLLRIINIPKRKIGDKTLEKIRSYAGKHSLTFFESLERAGEISGISSGLAGAIQQFYALIQELMALAPYENSSVIFSTLLEKIGYKQYLETAYEDAEARISNIEELGTSILELENLLGELSLRDYLENVSLVSATDDLQENQDYIKLMTIHNAKGLEFPIVFLVGAENETFPGSSKFSCEEDLEEERRLCYVAITRAEEKLIISFSITKYIYGDTLPTQESIFLKEIPEEYKWEEWKEKEVKLSKIQTKNIISTEDLKKKALNLPFSVGERVMHKKFGLGVVRTLGEKKIIVEFVTGKKEIAAIVAEKFLSKIES
ncbi:ATP-dependent helicase [Fusobacterium necrophorum]|uniref:DNA 3'-5' helicase n=2 Tax=Fusobacterium necrophorum TaxID=859 RepID=A0AB73C4Z3_9FUSO|nr:UvrD-helicase domain-containing protein [Fusobacterium necrophorum]KDE64562.1 ATPase AAA [Fusobacterium necrophorum BFTR-1]KDE66092.1 ATPase AAA [Fusobacterium necrophorum DJ-1]KDE72874.1 ATPase AAA [Fusobacterium necrophorum BFTR-2]KDE73090.1 ATPase AAA [Fusobacterium necrophorum DJ-2]MBR8733870.1 ATP-dependent DNA helicase PcrA [Fusobacterium necrophorum]